MNFRGWAQEVEDAVKLAAGTTARNDSVVKAADRLFTEMKGRITRELEIHRFTFTRPSKGSLQSYGQLRPPSMPVAAEAQRVNSGGKPLAKHWDAMWAAIAVKLWSGELKPTKQADLKAAMFEWFNNAGIAIGDTAVTSRARQLWQAMQDEAG